MLLINIENSKGGEDGLEIRLAEEYQAKVGRTVENGKLAIWTAKRKENLENISAFDSPVEVLIFKQAITEGWDCPRSHVMVELRQGMQEAFKVQVAGRLLRMPERKHYRNYWKDNAFIFTNDSQFSIEQDEDGPLTYEVESKVKDGISLTLPTEYVKEDWSDIQVEDGKFREFFFNRMSEIVRG